MARPHKNPEWLLLDLDVWEAPFSLTDDDLYAQAGADRRGGVRPDEQREDDQ
ncbi:MAG: hypothetical protein SWI22_10330 [Pseudomonadota bacterium]|nr:hypothetical protein [Pseudomonadota bacterium]